jgi:hypothetical protein
MKYPAHAFLFEDDEDTDRSLQPQGSAPYCSLPVQSPSRSNNLSPQTSGNFSSQHSRTSTATSLFTCCGFTIDLSNNQPTSSTSKSVLDDSLTRRSTLNKMPNPLSKIASYPQSSLSPDDRTFRQQKTVCYRSNISNRPNTRRRATTVVHCSSKRPSATLTTLTSPHNSSIHQSISKERQYLNFEKLSPTNDIPLTIKDGMKITINITEPPIIIQTDCDEPQLPAYIIETC